MYLLENIIFPRISKKRVLDMAEAKKYDDSLSSVYVVKQYILQIFWKWLGGASFNIINYSDLRSAEIYAHHNRNTVKGVFINLKDVTQNSIGEFCVDNKFDAVDIIQEMESNLHRTDLFYTGTIEDSIITLSSLSSYFQSIRFEKICCPS